MLIRRFARLIAIAIAVIVMLPVSAHAGVGNWEDTVGDAGESGLLDINKVTVIHDSKRASVIVRFPKADGVLPYGSFFIWIDSNSKKAGPEYIWTAYHPGESAFYPVKNWKPQWKKPWYTVAGNKKCGSSVKDEWNFDKGYAKVTMTRKKGCLGKPSRVRAAARTEVVGDVWDDYSDYEEYDVPEVDWYAGYRKMTGWVKK